MYAIEKRPGEVEMSVLSFAEDFSRLILRYTKNTINVKYSQLARQARSAFTPRSIDSYRVCLFAYIPGRPIERRFQTVDLRRDRVYHKQRAQRSRADVYRFEKCSGFFGGFIGQYDGSKHAGTLADQT